MIIHRLPRRQAEEPVGGWDQRAEAAGEKEQIRMPCANSGNLSQEIGSCPGHGSKDGVEGRVLRAAQRMSGGRPPPKKKIPDRCAH